MRKLLWLPTTSDEILNEACNRHFTIPQGQWMQWQWSNSNSMFSCLVGVSIHMYICIDILYLSVVWKRLQSGLQSSEESCTLRWTHLSVCFEVKYFDENWLKQFRMTKLGFRCYEIRLVCWLVRFYAALLQSRVSFLMRIKEFIL